MSFVGAGPGAADLITLRGARADRRGRRRDLGGQPGHGGVRRSSTRGPDAEMVDSVADRARGRARDLPAGRRDGPAGGPDPLRRPVAVGRRCRSSTTRAEALGLEVEIVPGVSAFAAAAAARRARADHPRGRPVGRADPAGGRQDADAASGSGCASSPGTGPRWRCSCPPRAPAQLVAELLAGRLPAGHPGGHRLPDELAGRADRALPIDELEADVQGAQAVAAHAVPGRPGAGATGTRSHLYHPGHFHGFRKPDPAARRALRASRRST